MITEYLSNSINKFTFSSGKEIILNDDELEELIQNSEPVLKMGSEIIVLKREREEKNNSIVRLETENYNLGRELADEKINKNRLIGKTKAYLYEIRRLHDDDCSCEVCKGKNNAK